MQIVPWHDKEEWGEAYINVYSDDVSLQEKAYTQMCIWKARYPNLPLGVECTMSILQVRLCDQQTNSSAAPYKERDLQLLYSTAVMRFLNHLSALSGSKESMYKMAEEQGIPDWLINLRHQAAHGSSVPALYLLRQASDIILHWLKVNYWLVESAAMEDVVISEENEREEPERIKRVLRLWLLLKTNLWADNTTLDSIVYDSERREVLKIVEEDLGITLTTNDKEESELKRPKLGQIEIDLEENSYKIKPLCEALISKLLTPAKDKSFYRKFKNQKLLIDCLANYEGFCPLIELDELSERDLLRLMSLLGQLWGELLSALQSARLLHLLLAALVSLAAERPTAHLWLRLLTHTLACDPPPLATASITTCRLLAVSLPCDVKPEVLFQRYNYCLVNKQPQLDLKPPGTKEKELLQQWARTVVHNPTALTNKYLKSLLRNFWGTGLNEMLCNQLGSLAKIYTTRLQPGQPVHNVHSVAALMDLDPTMNACDTDNEPPSPPSHPPTYHPSPWKLYEGDADWSTCGLGALPWQSKRR